MIGIKAVFIICFLFAISGCQKETEKKIEPIPEQLHEAKPEKQVLKPAEPKKISEVYLPDFVLSDPDGTKHESKKLLGGGLVLVATSPIYHSEKAQRGWNDVLLGTMPGAKTQLVFMEDMSASLFSAIARKQMHKEFKEDVSPLLLLDEDGKVSTELGVPQGETWVFAFNSKGLQVMVEKGEPREDIAKKMWKAAAGSCD